ncbi:MAG: DUF1987 domain-containing protein [Flavobacteriales bacterium]|jgi:hypothetical protein|nr:DUF1987 domain-containing protein [Flavobacteriales bacterium]
MNPIKLERTEYTPDVVLDLASRELSFRGECRPENVSNFFTPIVEWIENLKTLPPISEKLPVVFNLDYFNSSSAKYIMDIFFLISDINKDFNYNLEIVWEYDEDDEDVYEAGVEFEDLSGVNFTFKAL